MQEMKTWLDSIVNKIPETHVLDQPFLVSATAIIYCLQKLDKLDLSQNKLENFLIPLLKWLRLKPAASDSFPGFDYLCTFVPDKDRYVIPYI